MSTIDNKWWEIAFDYLGHYARTVNNNQWMEIEMVPPLCAHSVCISKWQRTSSTHRTTLTHIIRSFYSPHFVDFVMQIFTVNMWAENQKSTLFRFLSLRLMPSINLRLSLQIFLSFSLACLLSRSFSRIWYWAFGHSIIVNGRFAFSWKDLSIFDCSIHSPDLELQERERERRRNLIFQAVALI